MIVTEETAKTRRALFCSAVLSLWQKGFDTQQIAETLGEDQAGVERALHEAQNERWRIRNEKKE